MKEKIILAGIVVGGTIVGNAVCAGGYTIFKKIKTTIQNKKK